MIEFSERESKLFGLRFGRVNVKNTFADWNEIKREIRDMDLAYLRVKVADPANDFLAGLLDLSSCLYMTGIIRQYKMPAPERPLEYFNDGISFRKVFPDDRLHFKEVVKMTYSDHPLGYFQYPELARSFPIDLQLENVSSFFSDYFSGVEPGKEAHIGYIDDEPVACFASEFYDPLTTMTSYAGVKAGNRGRGLFRDILRQLVFISNAKGKQSSAGGARLENLPSQYAMEKEGASCYGHDLVYMVGFNKV